MDKRQLGKGHGIRIAHVDSGINPWHSHIHRVCGGVGIYVDEEGRMKLSDDYRDTLGHGTAVAAAVSEHVPEADHYAVKIFDRSLSAYVEVLCAAIEWCIDHEMQLINLSLGVKADLPELAEVCRFAEQAGIMIVSSCYEAGGLCWPGYYPSVFGVRADSACSYGQFLYTPKQAVDIQAYGLPRRLEGPIQKYNLQGHSFAAAHVTGWFAQLIEAYGIKSKLEMEEVLREWFAMEAV